MKHLAVFLKEEEEEDLNDKEVEDEDEEGKYITGLLFNILYNILHPVHCDLTVLFLLKKKHKARREKGIWMKKARKMRTTENPFMNMFGRVLFLNSQSRPSSSFKVCIFPARFHIAVGVLLLFICSYWPVR